MVLTRSFLQRVHLPFQRRAEWSNVDSSQSVVPLRRYSPSTLGELRRLVVAAEVVGTTVRAVGSGHSWSDVAVAPGFLVAPDNLNRPLDLEPQLLRPGTESGPPLVRVGSGMRIEELNEVLRGQGLSLPNMGGYDGQTVAGAFATSTHGSGIGFGPLSDLVVSLDIVGSGGAVYRIERNDGPTDPAAFAAAHPDKRLIQDDGWFRAASVGMGSLGLIHSMVLAVRDRHQLREVRTLSTWSRVRAELARGDVLLRNDHYEVLFSPYPRADGELECLVTTRNEISPQEYRRDHMRTRNIFTELLARFPLTGPAIGLVMRLFPTITPFLLHLSLTSLVRKDYVNESYKVFNIGAANDLPAYSAEIGIPIDSRGLHLKAVDEIAAVARKHRELGNTYQSSPISLRFVRATDSYMSMMEGRDTMMVELIMLDPTRGGRELLADYEDVLVRELEGRPHWGQVNHLTRERIEAMYPHFADWLAVRAQLNSSGVFDSPFTNRVGISA